MANKIDSESTAAVTDPSSGGDSSGDSSSVAGSKEKDGETTPIEGNVHKPEKNKESLVNSQRPKSGGGFNHKDEANAETGENKDQVQDAEPKKEPESGENKDQVQDVEPKKEPESGENKDQVQNVEPKQEPESGENKDQVQDTEAKQELESSWKGDSLDGTRKRPIRHASETESLQHPISTELPQNRQSQITVESNYKVLWISIAAAAVFVLVWVLCKCNSDSTPPVPKERNVVDVFNQEMEKLKTNFPNQRPELWRRSQIHLRRHLKTEHPTEPVSLILTSGHKAERTLGCLAQCLAQAFSTALNSSVLRIDGKSKTSQDSDQVKLDIDSDLKTAFEGKKIAAVIHRFEELPPGSTLIFYRYCDHENAAYKNVFLAFTVMLDAEVEVPTNVSLGRVEEMVQEHVKQKFVSSDKLANFNQMDVDKLSGLWSRISHLILPVSAEEKIERQGCEDCKSF